MTHDAEADRVIFNLVNCPPLYDDVKMQFFCPVSNPETTSVLILLWFLSDSGLGFPRLQLPREMIDVNP